MGFYFNWTTVPGIHQQTMGKILRETVLPVWALALPAALLPALRMRSRVRSWRRRGPGLCTACGYDLRATRERCPDCGTVCAVTASPPA